MQEQWDSSNENTAKYTKNKDKDFKRMLSILAEYGGEEMKRLATEEVDDGVAVVPLLVDVLRNSNREVIPGCDQQSYAESYVPSKIPFESTNVTFWFLADQFQKIRPTYFPKFYVGRIFDKRFLNFHSHFNFEKFLQRNFVSYFSKLR